MFRATHSGQPQPRRAGKCPFGHGGVAAKPAPRFSPAPVDPAAPDNGVLSEIRNWMGRELRCVAGRREYVRGNYLVRIASRQTVPAILAEFKDRLQRGAAIACLFVFPDLRYRAETADAATAFRFLAGQMAPITHVSPEELADGAALTTAIELTCPVTGQPTVFDDFECVAFCPQSQNRDDPLYDPLMYAPYPAVNMSSDVFGFSRFVADGAAAALGHPVWQEADFERLATYFATCADRWHRIAVKTIDNFAAATDTTICPVHRTADDRYWVAAHRDPAFAERDKIAHRHELPIIYANRIAQRWLEHFSGKTAYRATGLAQAGLPV